jgi:hypothetical protein
MSLTKKLNANVFYSTVQYINSYGICIVTIDMRIVSRPPPLFPLCADCVPFELVLSAALL